MNKNKNIVSLLALMAVTGGMHPELLNDLLPDATLKARPRRLNALGQDIDLLASDKAENKRLRKLEKQRNRNGR